MRRHAGDAKSRGPTCGSREGALTVLDRREALEIERPLAGGALARGADMNSEQQMEQTRNDQFRHRPAERDGQVVERGRDQKNSAEECVRSAARKALAEGHRDLVCGMNQALLEGVAEGVDGGGLAAQPDPTPGECCVTVTVRRKEM